MSRESLRARMREIRAEYEARRSAIMEQFQTQIRELPDNSRIRRLTQRCYVIQASQLKNNWSAEYHDFRYCYEKIAEHIGKSHDPDRALQRIIDDREIVYTTSIVQGEALCRSRYRGIHRLKLHPDIIEHLKTL